MLFSSADGSVKAKVRLPDGAWQTFEATWTGKYILDGHAIADEYRMFDTAGQTIVYGVNLRAYDSAKGVWNIKWLDALAGTWTDLATYANISETRFTWRGERSDDGETWDEFLVIEAYRDG